MNSRRMSGRKSLLTFLAVFMACFLNISRGYAHIPCMCNNPPDECTCFIQLGDIGPAVEGIIDELKTQGYLDSTFKAKKFTPEVKQAVIRFQADHDLECTGWMDDETLNELLRNTLPDPADVQSADFWDGICYVPTDGGEKLHSNPTCSNMKNPRMISRVNARSLGIQPCKRKTCVRYSPLTYSMLGLTPRELPESYYAEEELILETQDVIVTERSLSSDSTEALYIGNKESLVFHRGTCSSVKRMKDKNKVEFDSREEAVAQGFHPCSKCDP